MAEINEKMLDYVRDRYAKELDNALSKFATEAELFNFIQAVAKAAAGVEPAPSEAPASKPKKARRRHTPTLPVETILRRHQPCKIDQLVHYIRTETNAGMSNDDALAREQIEHAIRRRGIGRIRQWGDGSYVLTSYRAQVAPLPDKATG